MPRVWEIAALCLAMVSAGAIIATPTFPAEARVGAVAGILAACLYMAGRRRHVDR